MPESDLTYNIDLACYSCGTVNTRIKMGWDSVKAITTPVKRSDV